MAAASRSDYENIALHVHYAPLVEFNVFPHTESASQQLRVAYQLGPWVSWYRETNQAGVLRELRPYHALSLIADLNQAWGNLQWIGQLNHFLDDPQLYRSSSGATRALRIAQGLAFTLHGEAAFVRDLVASRARSISDTELLLDVAQLPTSYTAQVELGITYTFGSVHNTIVNPRFGRIDLQEEGCRRGAARRHGRSVNARTCAQGARRPTNCTSTPAALFRMSVTVPSGSTRFRSEPASSR